VIARTCARHGGVNESGRLAPEAERDSDGDNRVPTVGAFTWAADGPRRRYPDYLLPIAGQFTPTAERFADLREQLLLGYGYQTARAYRADLDDIYAWACRRGFDVLELSERQIRQYQTLLRRRRYSENTIRRRITALRRLYTVRGDESPGQAADGQVNRCRSD
jgi:Phage integrase, N-terminal SAM-like domain